MQAQGLQAPDLLAELTPEQWGLWRRHPITQLVLERYLPDFRMILERTVMDAWTGGKITLNAEQEARGRLLTTRFVEELNLPTVREFYGVAPQLEQNPLARVRP